MTTQRRIENFIIHAQLFEQIREHMQTVLLIEVSDDVVQKFLQTHPKLLASIIGYDEVDTTDRYEIWEACERDFPVNAKREF